jgi:hypothetical protein
MLFRILALVALASTTIASHHLNEKHMHVHDARNLNMLDKRQQQQYVPDTKTAPGGTCAAAFGSGYQTCAETAPNGNRFCFNPTVGEICCSGQWVCPPGNSCSNNYGGCCPPGVPAASCTAWAAPSPTQVKAASTSTSSSTTVVLPTVSSVPYKPSGSNGTAHTTGEQTTAQLPKFTGAASRVELSVAGLVGVAGLVAGLL